MLKAKLNIAILGSGAIGCLLACLLKRQGMDVHFIDPRLSQSRHLHLSYVRHNCTEFHTQIEQHAQWQNADYLLVCLKANHIEQALCALAVPSHCPILITSNGMGYHDHLGQHAFAASNTHGAWLQAKRTANNSNLIEVHHCGEGEIIAGSLHSPFDVSPLHALQAALPTLQLSDNITRVLWHKLAVNCIINPLTALHNCRNGALRLPRYHTQIAKLCAELSLVAAHQGLELNASALQKRVDAIAKNTADNFSSMHQDLHLRRRSEIDYINGYVLRCAKRHNICATLNAQLYQAIKHREKSYV